MIGLYSITHAVDTNYLKEKKKAYNKIFKQGKY